METINENTRICPLCGKKIHYRNVYEDGSDWLGHQRGSSKSYTIGYECTCDNIKFKKNVFKLLVFIKLILVSIKM